MGNQNCLENCKEVNENENILNHMASILNKNSSQEEFEEISKVKSSKQGTFDKKCNLKDLHQLKKIDLLI